MNNLLYFQDSYLKEFDAVVESVKNGKYVVLDRTAFYPSSGGQPHDTGRFIRKSDGKEFEVVFVGKFSGKISHEVKEPGLEEGDEVHGVIDWGRRYNLMRMHTAAHVISALFHDRLGAKITGNQKGVDRTRIDFDLDDFDRDLIERTVKDASDIMKEGVGVEVSSMPREKVLSTPGMVKLANKLPPDIDPLRIVKIGDVDIQADGGTHVKNTKEVGEIKVLDMKNKGKNNRRIYFGLE